MIFQTLIGGYSSLELVSWANGTPAQLAAMLDAHYAGRINIANYWSVGDSRTVSLSAIASNNCTNAMSAQTAQLVLMNFGGKTLVNAEHGTTNCACVVGFKNCLTGKGIWSTSSNYPNYVTTPIRTFLNNNLFLALPSDMQTLFKPFINKTTCQPTNTAVLSETEDLLVLPATIEVTGTKNEYELAGEGSQFSYYTTSANRIKTINGAEATYWCRGGKYSPSCITTSGTGSSVSATGNQGIASFGVI